MIDGYFRKHSGSCTVERSKSHMGRGLLKKICPLRARHRGGFGCGLTRALARRFLKRDRRSIKRLLLSAQSSRPLSLSFRAPVRILHRSRAVGRNAAGDDRALRSKRRSIAHRYTASHPTLLLPFPSFIFLKACAHSRLRCINVGSDISWTQRRTSLWSGSMGRSGRRRSLPLAESRPESS